MSARRKYPNTVKICVYILRQKMHDKKHPEQKVNTTEQKRTDSVCPSKSMPVMAERLCEQSKHNI